MAPHTLLILFTLSSSSYDGGLTREQLHSVTQGHPTTAVGDEVHSGSVWRWSWRGVLWPEVQSGEDEEAAGPAVEPPCGRPDGGGAWHLAEELPATGHRYTQ